MLLLDDIKSQTLPPRAFAAKKLLFTGPVGVGKTTMAKALAARHMGVESELGITEVQDVTAKTYRLRGGIENAFPFDFFHVNGADEGIDKIRELASASTQAPTDPRAKCRAFIIDEIHALPDKAIQALLLPLERDDKNLWIACTSRPAGQLDAALRSRLACHVAFGAADVAAVLRHEGHGENVIAVAVKRAQGDLRLALGGGDTDGAVVVDIVRMTSSGPKLQVRDVAHLLSLAVRNPYTLQAQILDALLYHPDKHAGLCGTFSQRHDIAAHQLVAACRKVGLI